MYFKAFFFHFTLFLTFPSSLQFLLHFADHPSLHLLIRFFLPPQDHPFLPLISFTCLSFLSSPFVCVFPPPSPGRLHISLSLPTSLLLVTFPSSCSPSFYLYSLLLVCTFLLLPPHVTLSLSLPSTLPLHPPSFPPFLPPSQTHRVTNGNCYTEKLHLLSIHDMPRYGLKRFAFVSCLFLSLGTLNLLVTLKNCCGCVCDMR